MAESQLQKAICKAVSIARLMCGNMDTAEEIVSDAISSLDPEDLPTDALFICVGTLAMQGCGNRIEQNRQRQTSGTSRALPYELQNVAKLSRIPRHCFVLRFLLGLSVKKCASLMQLAEFQVIDAACVAVSMLAVLRKTENGGDCARKLNAPSESPPPICFAQPPAASQ
jgi:hypothetical protein